MDSLIKTIYTFCIITIPSINGFSQKLPLEFKFRIVSVEEFALVRDSLKQVKDLFYSFNNVTCIGLTNEMQAHILGCLKNGISPYYGETRFMTYGEIAFGPWPAIKQWNQVVVNFEKIEDDNLDWFDMTEVRLLSGINLEQHLKTSHPWWPSY
jgi:hypothetical protein